MQPILRQGSRSNDVAELQRSLNHRLKLPRPLVVDGSFGPATRAAVLAYQKTNWLVEDGEVGPCTWAALRAVEKYAILVPTMLMAQQTDATCWSAATAMLLNRPISPGPGGANLLPDGSLLNDSELDQPVNTLKFAKAYGLTLVPGQSWLPDGLAALTRAHGRLMINTLWDATAYAKRAGSPGHMMVIAGIRGDGTPRGTTVRIYDPWRPHVGAVYSCNYDRLMRRVPALTYQIFYR